MDEIIKQIAQFLDREKIRYMVSGGQAVLMYGEPRTTKDIDITMLIKPDSYRRIADKLPQGFVIAKKNIEEFVTRTWVLPIQHTETGITVDLIFSATGFESEAIEKGKKIDKNGYAVNFISPEFLTVQKIFSGRARDLSDAECIVNVQREKLDQNKIESLLNDLDTELGQNDFIQRWMIVKKNLTK
jgi:hypothetical protein